MDTTIFFIFYILVLIFSVVIHEVTHGLVAKRLGDDTAEIAGRLTLNPLKHIDPIGSILVPMLMYLSGLPGLAWAKPVPYNPAKLYKDYRYGPLKVGLAGPGSNVAIAIVFAAAARVALEFGNPMLVAACTFIVFVNVFLAIFNLLPIPPLDGSKIFTVLLPRRYALAVEQFGLGGFILVLVAIYLLGSVLSVAALWITNLLVGGYAVSALRLLGL